MKIALLCFGIAPISSLSGMEKIYVEMANEFVRRGNEVFAVWNDMPGVMPAYKLDKRVKCINLGLGKIKVPVRYKILREFNKTFQFKVINKVDEYKTNKLITAINHTLNEMGIDVYICYEFNSVMVANKLSSGKIPVIAMVHNSVDDQLKPLTALQRAEANKVTVYQVLMPSYVREAQKILNTEIKYIPNIVPVVAENEQAKLMQNKGRYRIVHIGRIEGRQKRQKILVESFIGIAKKYPEWDLYFYGPIGDNEYKKQIDKLICKNNLEKRIIYNGTTNKPLGELSKGDIFAFPSAYEGFPLALTEAMASGLPVVGFKYAASVNELIKDEYNGYLCENDDEFKDRLECLMRNREKRVEMGKNAAISMKEFTPIKVWNEWEELLHKVIDD